MSIKVQKNTGTHNTTAAPGRKIEWIVIHYTAGNTSKKGSAFNTCSWFKNPAAGGSADFAVDDEEVCQYNPDISRYYCWSVGGCYPNKTTSIAKQYYGKCTNRNSISIELCSTKLGNTYNFTDKVLALGAEFTKQLMEQYGIDASHVITHHQVSGKNCPAMWTMKEADLQGWNNWKKKLTDKSDDSFKVRVLADTVPVRVGPAKTYQKVGEVKKDEIYTITKVENGHWGKLKSGVGYFNISEKYAKKI